MFKKTVRSFLTLSAAILLLAGTAVPSAQGAEAWSIVTSSTGSNPYVLGSVIASVLNGKQDRIRLSAQTSGGYNENLSLVALEKATIGMTFMSDLIDAYTGVGKFQKLPKKEMFQQLQLLFPHALSTYHYVVRKDSGIRTWEDLKGKRFNINVPATSTRGINEALIRALGYKLTDFTIKALSTKESFNAVRDRIVDATGNSSAVGGGAMLELATSTPVHLLPVSDEVFQRLNKDFRGTMVQVTIPANTYKGQTEPVKTFASPTTLFVHKNLSADLVYLFVKTFWESHDILAKENKNFKEVTLQIPFHPGAAKYFRERGVLK
jgi:TRAP transporter TAXI family solute receptor